MPKIIDYSKKRLEIATDAIEVFTKKGYYKTHLKDIAQATGMGRSSLYKYFKNKDEIYYYIVKGVYDNYQDQVEKVMEMEISNMDRLELLLEYLAHTLLTSSLSNRFLEFWMVIHRRDQEMEEDIFKLSDCMLISVEQLIKRAKEAGEIRAQVNEKALASIIMAAMESLALMREEDSTTTEEYLATMHLLVDGIKERG